MIARAIYLSGAWLLLSFILTLIWGTRIKDGGIARSAAWLGAVLFAGDIFAMLTFGVFAEVAGLTLLTFVFGLWCIWQLPNWNAPGHILWVISIIATFLYLIYGFNLTAFTPLHPLAFILALNLTFVETAALMLALTYAYESLDVTCRIRWNRRFEPRTPIAGYAPKVSLHIPAYNEPPEVVEATVRTLAQLDYPNFEVLIVDNNTPGEEIWRPLEKLCEDLGPRFRFLHLDKWPGYKSGALNFSATQVAPDTEIIGIIDADYLIVPEFLKELVPYFVDSRVAFVQAPQDYRDFEGNRYLEACYYAYKYFFSVSMPARNEHNAIIFAGTMGLFRRSVLAEIGGWDEWCITEDAEASLRVLKRGYQSVFVNKSYGTGLMPYSFDGLKKQRFRWCFGGIQILKKHWESMVPWARVIEPDNQMTFAQHYFYLMGALQWFSEPLNLLFTFFLCLGAVLHLSPASGMIRPITGPLLVIPAIFLLVGMWRFYWVIRYSLKLSYKDTLFAMGNFFSMSWIVTHACIQGLVQKEGVFLRTPKVPSSSSLSRVVRTARWETGIAVLCITLAVLVNVFNPRLATMCLGGMLLWQAILYLTALYFSFLSIRSAKAASE